MKKERTTTTKVLNPLVPATNISFTDTPPLPNVIEASAANNSNSALNTFQNVSAANNNNNSEEKLGTAIAKATQSVDSGQNTNTEDKASDITVSDERLKELFGDSSDSIVNAMAALNAYRFHYKDEAKALPNAEEKGVDSDEHVGMIAQELANNPVTEAAVEKDPLTGFLQVDTKELTMSNAAVLSELCKRVLAIEEVLKERRRDNNE